MSVAHSIQFVFNYFGRIKDNKYLCKTNQSRAQYDLRKSKRCGGKWGEEENVERAINIIHLENRIVHGLMTISSRPLNDRKTIARTFGAWQIAAYGKGKTVDRYTSMVESS